MRRRFFVDRVESGRALVAGEEARHLTKVLRVEPGQRYEISDNATVYLAEIEEARKSGVVFRTLEKLAPEPRAVEVTVLAALFKFDHFEWMIQKATELGAARIAPVIATRTEKGLERAAAKRIERWRRIALEASQQSRRSRLPELAGPLAFARALAYGADYRYVLDEAPDGVGLLTALPDRRSLEDSVAILAGPEGGWTDPERAAFSESGWRRVSLGPLILRAETAVAAALAVIGSAWQTAS